MFGDKANSPLLQGWAEDQAIDAKMLSAMIARAQKKVEMFYFDQRKSTLDYDDVMNVQRANIYGERRRIMEGADLRETIVGYLRDTRRGRDQPVRARRRPAGRMGPGGAVQQPEPDVPAGPVRDPGRPAGQEAARADRVPDWNWPTSPTRTKRSTSSRRWARKRAWREMRDLERRVTLQSLDRHWMEHLSAMDYLREGIGWRGYAGIDPLVLYKKEAYDMFQQMQASIQRKSSTSCPPSRSAWTRRSRRTR